MTGGERLAKVAEVLRKCRVEDGAPIRLLTESDVYHVSHMLAPLLDTFRAEDEARALWEAAEELGYQAEAHEWHRDHSRPGTPGSSQWTFQAAQWRQAEQRLRDRAERIGGGA